MRSKSTFTVPFRRKRQGRTYYKKRLKLLLSGKYRFVVRKSLRNFQVSLVKYHPNGDKVAFTVNSNAISKLGWKGDNGNLPSAYLIGMLAGKNALEKGIKEAILDLGFNNSVRGSRLYAALSGAIDSGLSIPLNQDVLPSKERISGEHITKYAHLLKHDKAKYEKQFSDYLKKGLNPEDITRHFNEIKGKIHG
ncbi:50S ribosomal protein L18 [Candidatus Woesearchaeota archaeon]|nr:50S ribosomal protein L18 [Candidatus Woesearchaeota archaeon]